MSEMIIPIILTILNICGIYGRPEIYTQPEQIHLSYGYHESEMVVTWVTQDDAKGTVVEYGSHKGGVLSNVVKGTSSVFTDDGLKRREFHIHRATLKSLIPGEEYIYHVGSDFGGWSDVFTFRAMKSGTAWSPTLVFMGDMGNVNAKSTPSLQKEVQKKKFDAIFHVGDFAYDFDDDNAKVGDAYMNQIQSFAAYIPYMTVVGNHEMAYNFSNYKNRFTMPGGDGNGMFYSMNVGPLHLIAFSSEFYYFTQYGWHQIIEQYKWLEKDLKEANKPENRAKQPWIITMCHRPLYCSNSNDPEHCGNMENMIRVGVPGSHEYSIEDLLYKYGVDIHFQAHEHSYERTWPVYNLTVCNGTFGNPYRNPRAPIHIVTGSGGCKEGVDPFVKAPAPWSAFQSDDYGYTIMKVANKTHVLLSQISVDKDGSVIDSITIEKDFHGMGSYDCHKFHEFQVKQDLFKKIFARL